MTVQSPSFTFIGSFNCRCVCVYVSGNNFFSGIKGNALIQMSNCDHVKSPVHTVNHDIKIENNILNCMRYHIRD